MAGWLDESGGIVGRESERRALTDFIEGIPSGLTTFLIEGDAGIGKSTVWRDGVAQAQERGCGVLVAQPAATEARLSFAGLSDLLEPVVDEVLPELAAPQRHALEVALLRAEAAESPLDERAVSVALLETIRLLADRAAVLVAIDDAHWLDRPSARVLDFAVRRLGDAPVGVLASVRVEERRRLAIDLERNIDPDRSHRVRLGPLSLAALHHLLQSRGGVALPRRLLLKVHELSGGNPFFAIELADVLGAREQPLGPGEPLPMSGTLNDLVAGRVKRLPARTREALLVASAAAQPSVQLIETFDPDADASDALATAERRAVIEVDRGRIRFSHPLVASAVYEGATAFDRQRVHRRLAEVVSDPEQRARHAGLAADGPDEHVAAALQAAADIAGARGAPDAAAELCELARQATPANAPSETRRLNLAAADYYFAAGDWDRAQVLAEEVISASGSKSELARAHHVLGKISYYGDSMPEAARLLRVAVEHAGEDAAARAPIELDLIYVLWTFEGFPAAAAYANKTLEHAETLGEPGLLAEALATAVMAEFLSGRGLDRAALERSLALEDRTRRVPVNLRPSLIAGLIMSWLGESAAGCAMLDGLRAWLIERGEEGELPMLASPGLVSAYCWHGDLETASLRAREIRDVAAQLDTDTARGLALCAMSTASAYVGDTDDARKQAHSALELFQRVGWNVAVVFPLTVLGFLHLSLDEPAEADRVLRPMVSLMEDAGLGEPSAAPFLPDEIEALIGVGELALAETLLAMLEDRARALDRAVSLAPAARCRGLLLAAQGDFGGAVGALERALEEHDRAPRPVEQARTLLALGQVQRRANQRRAARQTLERALGIFEPLGAAQWARRTRDELDRLGLRRRAGPDLTPSEAQVAERAASGMTNREIAGALFISPKTVEANLARVYRKLGISSRAELGRKMAERERVAAGKE